MKQTVCCCGDGDTYEDAQEAMHKSHGSTWKTSEKRTRREGVEQVAMVESVTQLKKRKGVRACMDLDVMQEDVRERGSSRKDDELAGLQVVDGSALVTRVTDAVIAKSVTRRHKDRAVPFAVDKSDKNVAVVNVGTSLVVEQLLGPDVAHGPNILDRIPVDVAVARVCPPRDKNAVQLPGVDPVAEVLQSACQAPHRIATCADVLRARGHLVLAPPRIADPAICWCCCEM